MPFRRRTTFSRRRKYYRRSRKGRARGRFARKRFMRKAPGLRAGLYIPRQAYVKLPFVQIMSNPLLTVSSGIATWTFGVQGNGICCPLSTSLTGQPGSGERYPLGLEQYAGFYKFYKVLGSSLKIQYSTTSTTALSAVMVVLAGQGAVDDTDTDSNWQKFLNAPTQELIQYPGASWKSMSGIHGETFNFLKGFRKTKSMIGRKDIRDNDDTQGLLPGTEDQAPNGTNPQANDTDDSFSGSWFWMVRIALNTSGNVAANTFDPILKMKYYTQLYGRDFNTSLVVPA